MTPIEAAARAIANELDGHPEDWRDCIPEARAAIAAICEPSEAMVQAGEGETTPEGCWSMMVEAALAEGTDA